MKQAIDYFLSKLASEDDRWAILETPDRTYGVRIYETFEDSMLALYENDEGVQYWTLIPYTQIVSLSEIEFKAEEVPPE